MRLILSFILLPLLAAPSLHAQSTGFDAQGALVLANSDLTKLTHSSTLGGLSLGLGYTTQVTGAGVPLRLSFNAGTFPGHTFGTVKSGLTLAQLAADVHVATPLKDLSLIAGLSANKYWLHNSGTPSGLMSDVGNSSVTYYRYDWALTRDRGVKLGARVGLEYRLSPRLVLLSTLQMTELGTGSYGPINPSWLEVGTRWRF